MYKTVHKQGAKNTSPHTDTSKIKHYVYTMQVNLHNHAPDTIHGPLDFILNLIPIGPPFRKLINLFRSKDAVEAIAIRDNGS